MDIDAGIAAQRASDRAQTARRHSDRMRGRMRAVRAQQQQSAQEQANTPEALEERRQRLWQAQHVAWGNPNSDADRFEARMRLRSDLGQLFAGTQTADSPAGYSL